MKYVVEFGVRGGAHTDNLIVPTQKLAKELANRLVMVFTNDPHCDQFQDFAKGRSVRRASWTSSTHFVSVSPLDGVMRGPASNALWKT
jgi:hypothetical protein